MCKDWATDFSSFKEWAVQSGYRDDLQIDRIDNDGDYCPENCRWTHRSAQIKNSRKRGAAPQSVFRGVQRRGRWWRPVLCITGKDRRYFGHFLTEIEAAIAYDDACFSAFGDVRRLNFPERKRQRVA